MRAVPPLLCVQRHRCGIPVRGDMQPCFCLAGPLQVGREISICELEVLDGSEQRIDPVGVYVDHPPNDGDVGVRRLWDGDVTTCTR